MRAKPYIEGSDSRQATFLPELLDDLISESNPIRFIEAFVDSLDLVAHGFSRAELSGTGAPSYNPAYLLKLYIYGYTNRLRTSRRLERESRCKGRSATDVHRSPEPGDADARWRKPSGL